MQTKLVVPKILSFEMTSGLKLIRDIFRYAGCSAVALIVDASLLYILTSHMGMHYIASASLAFCAGLTVNYVLSKIFVFGGSKYGKLHEFMVYAFIGICGLLLNDLIMFILVEITIWYMYAKAFATVAVFFFNFFLRRQLFTDADVK